MTVMNLTVTQKIQIFVPVPSLMLRYRLQFGESEGRHFHSDFEKRLATISLVRQLGRGFFKHLTDSLDSNLQ